jgi:aminoglycoside phosphotransferase (APT) family kinase protein
VAEPLWLCEDPAVLGQPFYVMRRVAGEAAGHRVVADTHLGGDRPALAERLGGELSRLHTITPPRSDLPFLNLPKPNAARGAVTTCRGYLDALGEPQPGLEWGLRWCEIHAPPPGDIVLVHQDFRTGNYMLDGNGLTAILDWEFAAWGDPMSDLGWFCAKCWRYNRKDLEAGGIATREPFYRGYEAESGRRVDPERVAYWELLAHIRWAAIALQQGRRTAPGGEASLELALTGRLFPPELEQAVLAATPPAAWADT